MTILEGRVRKIERIRWYVGGAALAVWAVVQAGAQWLIQHKQMEAPWATSTWTTPLTMSHPPSICPVLAA